MLEDKNTIKNKQGHTVAVKFEWWREDVLQCAKDNGIKITKKQASDVLDYCKHKHDANIGMNWEYILYAIDQVLEGN